MKFTAAFLWNNSNKSISYMIINQHTKVIVAPKKHSLKLLNMSQFFTTVNTVIFNFFQSIIKIYHEYPKSDICIEYQIVHSVAHDLTGYYKVSARSEFVRLKFFEQYALTKAKILSVKLAQQLRVKLKRPDLDIFKSNLKHLGLVKAYRDNQFEFHLWMLAMHETKTNYIRKLQRIVKYHQPRARA